MQQGPAISVSTVVIDGLDFARGLDLIAEAGAAAIEPAYISGYMPFDEITFTQARGRALAATAANAGLAIRAVSVHMDLGEADSVDKLLRRLDFVAAAGADILVTNATAASRQGEFEATVSAVLDRFSATGVILAVENPGHGTGALLPSGQEAARVVSTIGHPNLRLNYDAGNALTHGARHGTALDDLAAALPLSAHVHLKDVLPQDEDWHFCPVGDGMVGYDEHFFALLGEAGIPVGIEHPIRLWRPGRGDPVRRADVPSEAMVRHAVQRSLAFVEAGLNRARPA